MNGKKSRDQLWSDVKSGKVHSKTDSPTNYKTTIEYLEYLKYRTTIEYLEYLKTYSEQGVDSVSEIIGLWTSGKQVHSLLHSMCRRKIHPDHWVDAIDAFTTRSDRSIKVVEFLKQPQYEALWGEGHASPRNLTKRPSKKELEQKVAELEMELEKKKDENKSLEERSHEAQDQLTRMKAIVEDLVYQLKAERECTNGDAYEKQLMLKDLNGTPDNLGWYKLDQMRRAQSELENHFGVQKKEAKNS